MTQLRPSDQPGELPAIHARLQAQADNAYAAYLNICRMDACLGWEIKVERGFFGQAEISAHKAGLFCDGDPNHPRYNDKNRRLAILDFIIANR